MVGTAGIAAVTAAALATLQSGGGGRTLAGGAQPLPPLPQVYEGGYMVSGLLNISDTQLGVLGSGNFAWQFDGAGDLSLMHQSTAFEPATLAWQPALWQNLDYSTITSTYNASNGLDSVATILSQGFGPQAFANTRCVRAMTAPFLNNNDVAGAQWIQNTTEANGRTYSSYAVKSRNPYIKFSVVSVNWEGVQPNAYDPFCGGNPFWASFVTVMNPGAYAPAFTGGYLTFDFTYQKAYPTGVDLPSVLFAKPPATCTAPGL